MKIHIKNQLNKDLTIELCLGQHEYTLLPGEEVEVEVNDQDCMYLDVVREMGGQAE